MLSRCSASIDMVSSSDGLERAKRRPFIWSVVEEFPQKVPYWHTLYEDDDGHRWHGHDSRAGTALGEFHEPFGVAVSTAGDRLYVSEREGRRIQVLSLPDGRPLRTIHVPSSMQPKGICVDAQGRLYYLAERDPRIEIQHVQNLCIYAPLPALA